MAPHLLHEVPKKLTKGASSWRNKNALTRVATAKSNRDRESRPETNRIAAATARLPEVRAAASANADTRIAISPQFGNGRGSIWPALYRRGSGSHTFLSSDSGGNLTVALAAANFRIMTPCGRLLLDNFMNPPVRRLALISMPLFAVSFIGLAGCKAKQPSRLDTKLVREIKEEITIGGEDLKNPVARSEAAVTRGAEHFQHHCQICHGLDGQNTGVPFASKMSPPVADLKAPHVQEYTDGQLKWIIENGIRYTGMPAWKGIIDDSEMWHIVHYLRALPPKGSLGIPRVFEKEQRG